MGARVLGTCCPGAWVVDCPHGARVVGCRHGALGGCRHASWVGCVSACVGCSHGALDWVSGGVVG